MAINAIVKFLSAARSLVDQGLSKEAIEQFARNEFGEINELFQKQINNLFKPKQGIENIKIKDEVFDDTVIKLPIDDTGKPFNPRDPLKDYSKELTDSPLDDLKKIVDDFEPMGPPKPRDKKYTGGMVDVEPNLSDIGHGSDALMARTRLVSPGSQSTTSTGLNYLLAEDNDNIRVPFSKGKAVEKGLNYLMDLFTNKKMFRSKDDVPTSGFSEKTGPITIEDMINIPEDELRKIRRTQELGLYDETPEILKAGNLFERFTKKVGGERVIDYDRAEFILNRKLKGNETLNDLLQIEYQTRPGRADGGRIGFSKGKLADVARRKFMKTAGAGAAGLAALKTGLIGLGEKAAPVVEKTVEYTAPALNKIVETVMSVGDLISQSGRRLKELTTKKKFKDIEVEEDMMDGPSYTIKKDGETIYYRPGKQDESGGFEDDIIEVIDETITKKASGGIARMIGE